MCELETQTGTRRFSHWAFFGMSERQEIWYGPFAETREQLGGYFLIDAKDRDEAIGIAARIPGARLGTVEIRPVMEIAGLPTDDGDRGPADR